MVPQFYLNYWAIDRKDNSENDEIFVLDKRRLEIRKQKTRNVGGRNNLFNVGMLKGTIFGKDFFERALSELDNRFAGCLRTMIAYLGGAKDEIDEETRWGLAEFIGSQMMRHAVPQTFMRNRIGEESFDKIMDASGNLIKENGFSEKEFRESVMTMFTVRDVLTGAIGTPHNPHNDPSRDMFLDYRWVVAKAPPDKKFVTSDFPPYLHKSLVKRYELRKFSLPYEVYFPIAPEYMIYMFRKEVIFAPTTKEYEIREFNKGEVEAMNSLKAIYCEREIYSDSNEELERLKDILKGREAD